MKRNVSIGFVAIFVVAVIAAVSMNVGGYTYDTVEKLLNRMVESSADENSIKVEFVNTVSDFTVHNETALTNTVDPTFQIRHTTTGTPANGIGLSVDFKQETSASNEEIGARIAAVTTDTTATSEDFKIDFMTMAAGATAATTMSLGSTGILTMVGGATVDNATSATNFAITETNIGLTGATTITGTGTVTGALAANGGITVDSTAFTVADTSGNVATTGTLTVGGTAALNNGITVDSTAFTVADTTGNVATAGTLTATGSLAANGGITVDSTAFTVADTTGNVATTGDLSVGGWAVWPPTYVTAQDYTISSTGKAAYYAWEYSDTGTGSIFLPTGATEGTYICVADADLNANNNNLTVRTEGSETINEAATYVLNAAGESICVVYHVADTDWVIYAGYNE